MKRTHLFLCFCLVLGSLGYAREKDWDLRLETLSSAEIQRINQYKPLQEMFPGFHTTVIRFHQFPDDEAYLLKWTRPLFDKKEDATEVPKQQLFINKELLSEKQPNYIMYSKGFLPGEPILFWVETKDGWSKSAQIEVIPQPIILEDAKGDVKLTAKLAPGFTYSLSFEGMKDGEIFTLISQSSDETIKQKLHYTKGLEIGYSPSSSETNTGTATVSIIREHGEIMEVSLPWGMEHLYHLNGESKPIISDFKSIKY